MGNVTRRRVYENDAARQRAYRERLRQRREREAAALRMIGEIVDLYPNPSLENWACLQKILHWYRYGDHE